MGGRFTSQKNKAKEAALVSVEKITEREEPPFFALKNANKVVVIVGTTGTGKSTIINMLVNNDITKHACEQPCGIGSGADSVTKEPQWHYSQDGKAYGDTIGLSDPNLSDIEISWEIQNFIKLSKVGVHCIIIVAKYGRLSTEERCNLEIISRLFDKRWVDSCIMVLTHYDGQIDSKSYEKAMKNWLGEDKQINDFVSMIGNRVILTDNSLGKHEKANRPFRQNCLNRLTTFINECNAVVGPAETNFLDTLKFILETYFAFYRITNAKQIVVDIIRYLQSDNTKSGGCPICFEEMELSNILQINCSRRHSFHKDCILTWIENLGRICPVCNHSFEKFYQV